MKRLIKHSFALLAVASLVTFVSCSDEDEVTPAAPSVSATFTVDGAAATTAALDSKFQFAVSATAEAGINRIVGYSSVESGAKTTLFDVSRTDLGIDAGATTATYTSEITTFSGDLAGKVMDFEIIVVDDVSGTDTTKLSVTFEAIKAKTTTQVLLYAPTGDGMSSTFYSVSKDIVYTDDQVTGTADPISADIDFGYYYGGDNKATLAAISVYPSTVYDLSVWGTKNATKLVKTEISSETYTSLTYVSEVESAFADVDFSAQTGFATDLAVNDVVAFETVGGAKGFILVQAIDGTFNQGDKITLDIILAEAE